MTTPRPMAIPRLTRALSGLLSAPLALLTAGPAGAWAVADRVPWAAPLPRAKGALVAQAAGDIPAEVQGWFDGAKAAAARGDGAQALELQKRVLAWLEANPGTSEASLVFRARALNLLGVVLSSAGQNHEALAPTLNAIGLLRPLEGRSVEARRFLAMALNNLGNRYSDLGRHQEALFPTKEAAKI